MPTVTIDEDATDLSALVDRATRGETVVVARRGRPVAKLVPVEVAASQERRLGFMEGAFAVPNDFDTMGADEIAEMFESKP